MKEERKKGGMKERKKGGNERKKAGSRRSILRPPRPYQ